MRHLSLLSVCSGHKHESDAKTGHEEGVTALLMARAQLGLLESRLIPSEVQRLTSAASLQN